MTSTNNNSNPIVNNASSRLFSLDPSQRIQLDLYANESIDEQSSKIYEALKDDMFCIRLKQLVWEHMYCEKQLQLASTSSTNAIVPSEIKAKIKQCMQQYGYKNVMHNVVTRTYERIRMNSMRLSELAHSQVSNASVYARRSIDERNETIREVRMQWERGINEELLAIGMELKRKFAICRPNGVANPLMEEILTQVARYRWLANASVRYLSIPQRLFCLCRDNVRFLYDSEDLYETCINIKNNNNTASIPGTNINSTATSVGVNMWNQQYVNTLKLRLRPASFESLVSQFKELSMAHMQFGIDELNPNSNLGSKFAIQRHEEGMNLLQEFNSSSTSNQVDTVVYDVFPDPIAARKYLRRGCPPSLRRKMWRVAFGCSAEISTEEVSIFNELRSMCDKYDLLTDELFVHDVCNVADDFRYFVFEDDMKLTALCFSRDDRIRQSADYETHKPLLGHACPEQQLQYSTKNGNKYGNNNMGGVSSPPCGVQPFLGLAAYFAPLCYVSNSPACTYSLAYLTYCRIWCRMNVLTSDDQTLLQTCCTFENLLIHCNMKLFLHLLKLGIKPLNIALPWMQLGYVGLLEVDQVLILWDRLFGYMDTNILAVFGVSVFLFRSVQLFHCSNAAEAIVVLNEGLGLKVVPLLQMVLCGEFGSSYYSAATSIPANINGNAPAANNSVANNNSAKNQDEKNASK